MNSSSARPGHLRRVSVPPPADLNPRRDPPLDFPDRTLEDLKPDDYRALGFLCGLEVHQQLLTRSKLFCRCPAGRRVTRVDAEVLRHMRPTLSELGEYDGCALMEFKTRKEIVYLLERGTVCTYEMDDTPPFEIDEEAVKTAVEVALLFGLKLVSELQVMRKQYLDGSIPTGFQRTAMMGIDGVIPFRESELGRSHELSIRQLTLEEDSCREVADVGHRITFRTDRLGTPLIETVTEPELLTPRDVAAGGRLLAAVAHTSRKVRRGPGAARQDVNVSVAGGRRVEIKGVATHRCLPRLVHTEAFRQLNLLRIRAELQRRGVTRGHLAAAGDRPVWETDLAIDASSALKQTEYAPMRDALAAGHRILAVRLPGFVGLLTHRTQPGLSFTSELADRVRVIACLTDRPFMIASHGADHALHRSDWRHLRRALGADSDDEIVVVWGPERDVETAAREVLARAAEALDGVPSETRQAFADGTTGFERILPGPERMYPDTDSPPLPIPDAWVSEIHARLGERPWSRAARYEARGLSADAARRLADAPWAALFDALDPRAPATARRLAAALEKRLVHFWRETGENALPAAARLRAVVDATDRGEVRPEAFEPIFDRLLREVDLPAERILRDYTAPLDAESEVARWIDEVALERASGKLRSSSSDTQIRWAMGRVMPRLLGRFDPTEIAERIRGAFRAATRNPSRTTAGSP